MIERLRFSAKRIVGCLIGGESGMGTFMAVLILLILGALIVTPMLSFTISGMRQGLSHERMTHEFYAADTGIEDAMYKIRNNLLPDWMLRSWDDDTYKKEYTYTLGEPVNDRGVTVTIRPIWLLEGLEDAHKGRLPHQHLVTVGQDMGGGQFQIVIVRDEEFDGQLKLDRIGVWLPPGCGYVAGTSNLEQDLPVKDRPTVTTTPFRSGTVVTWDFHPAIDHSDLLGEASGQLNRKVVTFEYTGEGNMMAAWSYTRTIRMDTHLSWNSDIRLFEITSVGRDPVTGDQTTIIAHTTKDEGLRVGSAVAGDYAVTGNALLRNQTARHVYRERLYLESPGVIGDIPSSATPTRIILYWSGWKNSPWNAWYEANPDVSQWSAANQKKLNDLVTTYKVNQVSLKVNAGGVQYGPITVDASTVQALPNGSQHRPNGWSYSCKADVTDLVKDFYSAAGISFNGNATYTVGHAKVDAPSVGSSPLYGWKDGHSGEVVVSSTDYALGNPHGRSGLLDEWAYAAWSVMVVYADPDTPGRQLYIYDKLRYVHEYQTVEFKISNFLAPRDVLTDPKAARLTFFVGEGDEHYAGSYLSVNGEYLTDPPGYPKVNPINNVWNARSNIMVPSPDGIDIDTFWAGNGIIQPGDTEAEVLLKTQLDSYNLIFVILSFRSDITTGGILSYRVL